MPFIESVFGFKFFAKDVYQITELPSELQTPDVVLTAAFSFVLSPARDDLPELARVEGESGGGAAL